MLKIIGEYPTRKDIEKIAGDIPGALGTGGMLSKVKAAKKVTSAGIPMVISEGEKPDILIRLFYGEEHGTYFVPKTKKSKSKPGTSINKGNTTIYKFSNYI